MSFKKESFLKSLENVSNKKEAGVLNGVFGGSNQAPAYTHSKAFHVAKVVPEFYGKKSIVDVVNNGEAIEAKTGLDEELRLTALAFKKHIHSAVVQADMMKKNLHREVSIEQTPMFQKEVLPLLKAFNVTDFAQWIPTVHTNFFFTEFETEPSLANLFPQREMSSSIEKIPTTTSRMIGHLVADTTSFTAQYNTTDKVLLEAQDCAAYTILTQDLIQDATPSMFEFARMETVRGLNRAIERAIIDGDNTSSHQDSDVTDALDFRKAWKGLRKKALANTANGSTYNQGGEKANSALFGALVDLAGVFATDVSDLLWIISPKVRTRIITGGIPEIVTLQNAGAFATMFKGQVPPIWGIDSYCSMWSREDLGAAGVYSAASALATVLLVKKSRFMVGNRQAIRMWAEPLQGTDTLALTAKTRVAFNGNIQDADEKSALIGYNIAL